MTLAEASEYGALTAEERSRVLRAFDDAVASLRTRETLTLPVPTPHELRVAIRRNGEDVTTEQARILARLACVRLTDS
jgi:hypothetical protein